MKKKMRKLMYQFQCKGYKVSYVHKTLKTFMEFPVFQTYKKYKEVYIKIQLNK